MFPEFEIITSPIWPRSPASSWCDRAIARRPQGMKSQKKAGFDAFSLKLPFNAHSERFLFFWERLPEVRVERHEGLSMQRILRARSRSSNASVRQPGHCGWIAAIDSARDRHMSVAAIAAHPRSLRRATWVRGW